MIPDHVIVHTSQGFILSTETVCNDFTTPGVPPPSPCATSPGNNARGATCHFPFSYNGVAYSMCIRTVDRDGPWCSLTANYNVLPLWGYCTGREDDDVIISVQVTLDISGIPFESQWSSHKYIIYSFTWQLCVMIKTRFLQCLPSVRGTDRDNAAYYWPFL